MISMVKISAIRKNHLPMVKIDFTIPESAKKIMHMKNTIFLHHCFKTFDALTKLVPRIFLSFRSKASKAAKLFFEVSFLGNFLENTCDVVYYQKIVRLKALNVTKKLTLSQICTRAVL